MYIVNNIWWITVELLLIISCKYWFADLLLLLQINVTVIICIVFTLLLDSNAWLTSLGKLSTSYRQCKPSKQEVAPLVKINRQNLKSCCYSSRGVWIACSHRSISDINFKRCCRWSGTGDCPPNSHQSNMKPLERWRCWVLSRVSLAREDTYIVG